MINEKEKEDEERRTPLSGKACGIISYHRQGVYRDHQSPVDSEPAEGDGTFYVGSSWRIRSFFPCAPERLGRCAQEDQRRVRPHAEQQRQEGAGDADLLSQREDPAGEEDRRGYGELV